MLQCELGSKLREMNKVSRAVVIFIAQGAYAGRFPIAPGTAGTVVGVLLYPWIKGLSPGLYTAFCLLLFAIGTWAAGNAEELLGKKDHSSIVIDEIAGYMVSMFLVPPAWGFVVAGFFLFRFFDIVKPYPLNRLQEIHGGLGVMLDDIGAGVYTNIVLQVVSGLL
jgi:phosphatidylglycerophosphatase A